MPLKEKSIKAAVIGGDARQIFIANELISMGYAVSVFALGGEHITLLSSAARVEKSAEDALRGAFLVILPIPFSRDKKTLNAPYFSSKIYLEEFFDSLSQCDVVALGMIDEKTKSRLSAHSFTVDYATNEIFTIKNAFATAEAALAVVIEALPKTLGDSTVALVGYGRIARALAGYLHALGASVNIFARSEKDRVHAKMCGYKSYKTNDLSCGVYDADILINTVPAIIIDENVLRALSCGVKITELASAPGGVDRDAAKRLSIDIIDAQSLPARFSPQTAAKTVLESVFSSLSQEVCL